MYLLIIIIKNLIIKSMIVIGTDFTFYKAIIHDEYLESLYIFIINNSLKYLYPY
jgi:hypothetical protein